MGRVRNRGVPWSAKHTVGTHVGTSSLKKRLACPISERLPVQNPILSKGRVVLSAAIGSVLLDLLTKPDHEDSSSAPRKHLHKKSLPRARMPRLSKLNRFRSLRLPLTSRKPSDLISSLYLLRTAWPLSMKTNMYIGTRVISSAHLKAARRESIYHLPVSNSGV
jgi:hypothetical protein